MLDGKLARGDNALCLVTDVEEYFVPVDFDDGTFDEVPVVEELECFLDFSEEVFGTADVVDSDLLGARSCCRCLRDSGWAFLLGPPHGCLAARGQDKKPLRASVQSNPGGSSNTNSSERLRPIANPNPPERRAAPLTSRRHPFLQPQ